MMRALGRAIACPAHPRQQEAAHRAGLADAHGRDLGLDILHRVVDRQPAVTTPPGELMYMLMSLVGFSDSRNSSWATITLAM
jgi:hypothetical protein